MRFEEIFNEKGNYKAEGFMEGYCYEVDSEGFLWGLHYRDINDVNPIRERAIMYKGMFDKNFVIVYNRGQLFD